MTSHMAESARLIETSDPEFFELNALTRSFFKSAADDFDLSAPDFEQEKVTKPMNEIRRKRLDIKREIFNKAANSSSHRQLLTYAETGNRFDMLSFTVASDFDFTGKLRLDLCTDTTVRAMRSEIFLRRDNMGDVCVFEHATTYFSSIHTNAVFLEPDQEYVAYFHSYGTRGRKITSSPDPRGRPTVGQQYVARF